MTTSLIYGKWIIWWKIIKNVSYEHEFILRRLFLVLHWDLFGVSELRQGLLLLCRPSRAALSEGFQLFSLWSCDGSGKGSNSCCNKGYSSWRPYIQGNAECNEFRKKFDLKKCENVPGNPTYTWKFTWDSPCLFDLLEFGKLQDEIIIIFEHLKTISFYQISI